MSPLPVESEGVGFHPQTFAEGDQIVLPFTLLDGTSGQLVYPPDLDLDGGRDGAVPYGSGGTPSAERDFAIEYGTPEEVRERYGNVDVLGSYDDGRGGTIELWTFGNEHWLTHLAFGFDTWTVMVWDYHPDAIGGGSDHPSADERMSEEERALWATNLRGTVTADGFLMLEPRLPIVLEEVGPYGPSLSLSGQEIGLSIGRCDREYMSDTYKGDLETSDGRLLVRPGPRDARWCDLGTGLYLSAYGSSDTVDRMIDELELRNVSPAPAS